MFCVHVYLTTYVLKIYICFPCLGIVDGRSTCPTRCVFVAVYFHRTGHLAGDQRGVEPLGSDGGAAGAGRCLGWGGSSGSADGAGGELSA